MITEKDLSTKYAVGTPYWKKDSVERYLCEKHDQPTVYLRDDDLVVHTRDDTECF